MAIKFEKLKPGMKVFDIHSESSGNTSRRRLGCWEVEIISVDTKSRTAVCSWNCNKPTTWSERNLSKLYASKTKKYLAQVEARKL